MRWLAALVVLAFVQALAPVAGAWEGTGEDSVAWEGATAEVEAEPADPVAAAEPAAADRIDYPVFRLDIPFRTQKDGGLWQVSNCGPATLGMVLDAFGVGGQATDDLRFRSHTYQGTWGMRTGTALQHIARVAEDFGIATFGLYEEGDRFRTWSLDDIREQLRLGRPVMVLARLYLLPGREGLAPRFAHYILVTGLTEDGFFYSDALQMDPEPGAMGTIPAAQLERAMQWSTIPGQAVAFGGAGLPPLTAWVPGDLWAPEAVLSAPEQDAGAPDEPG